MRRAAASLIGHVRKRACASLISDVYIQGGARMLVVSRCWVGDHAHVPTINTSTIDGSAIDGSTRT
jgi:hypothetical protein